MAVLNNKNMKREIKFRAWNTDYTEKPLMEYFAWNDIKSIERLRNKVEMEFTGLTDKNGKEIYEEDYCFAKFRTKDGIQVIQGKIIMHDFMWCIDCVGRPGDDIFSINRLHDFEVIGNIYETKELFQSCQY